MGLSIYLRMKENLPSSASDLKRPARGVVTSRVIRTVQGPYISHYSSFHVLFHYPYITPI